MSVDESLRASQYRDASNLNARIALHEQFSTNSHSLPLWLFDQLELPDDARILEIGCGSGNLWAENTKRIPEGWQISRGHRLLRRRPRSLLEEPGDKGL